MGIKSQFLDLRTGSWVRTCSDPELNLVEPVLLVLVRGSPHFSVKVHVRFAVLSKRLQNRTEPNFGNPTRELAWEYEYLEQQELALLNVEYDSEI